MHKLNVIICNFATAHLTYNTMHRQVYCRKQQVCTKMFGLGMSYRHRVKIREGELTIPILFLYRLYTCCQSVTYLLLVCYNYTT